jgi:predicted metal-dependent peptidase
VIIKTQPQFVFKNRRMTFLDKKFMIPNEYDNEIKSVIRPDILLFLDCSGSCASIRGLFFDLAKTIDPKKYNVRLFSRTTEVREIFKDKEGKYKVPNIGGSDDFRCIERHIQRELQEGKLKKYPIVIHFTDGGDCSNIRVKPEKPEFWYWMLQGNNRRWIPKECKHIYGINQII